ncbi:MAG: hypothetical protein AAGJ83_12235, partial [Planctomycetota bacterium]
AMGASTGLPYLSKDWESGRKDEVGKRVNLMLKLVGMTCFAGSTAILVLAPTLFGQLWKDKFAIGESLLPMALAFCSLAAMGYVAQAYFWCVEKAWVGSVVLFLGLVTNSLLGFVLIRSMGIEGVVASTLVAHAVVLVFSLIGCQRRGLPMDPGVLVICVLVPLICFGKWFAGAGFAILIILGLFTELLIDRSSRRECIRRTSHIIETLRRRVSPTT